MQKTGKYNLKDRTIVADFLANREEKDFRRLYRRYSPQLNQLIVRLAGSANGDAQDIIQTTWIRAIEKLPGFQWRSSLKTWLTGIAINCCREHNRKNRRVRFSEFSEYSEHHQTRKLNHTVPLMDIEKAIKILPDGYREILILHDIEGYTHREIAEFLEIEIGTSKSQLFRARNFIRKTLSGTDGDGNEPE